MIARAAYPARRCDPGAFGSRVRSPAVQQAAAGQGQGRYSVPQGRPWPLPMFSLWVVLLIRRHTGGSTGTCRGVLPRPFLFGAVRFSRAEHTVPVTTTHRRDRALPGAR